MPGSAMGVLNCCHFHALCSLPSTGFGAPGPVTPAIAWAGWACPFSPAVWWRAFRNRHTPVSFYGTMPTWQLSHHLEYPVWRRAASQFFYTGFIKEQSGLWVQVPSDTEEELAGTGNTDAFRFSSLWKHLHGLCSYSAVAACPPPLPGSLCG